MTLHHRRAWVPLVVVALALGATSCNQPESGTRNVVDVVSLNGNAPLQSDVYNLGDNKLDPSDDFIPVDIVEVTFRSRPHDKIVDSTVGPGTPFGSVRFLSYNLVWAGDNPNGADLDGDGTVDLPNQTDAAMNVVVPTGQAAQAYISIVSGGAKTVPPVSCLGPVGGACAGVTGVEFVASATITFFGTEETSGDGISLTRGLNVFIGDWGDD